jgi:PAS domain S-box-containing protein
MNVLIVDDQEDNRYLLRTLFSGIGDQTVEAVNGRAALEALDQGSFDLVISDILMPVMDGYQFCRDVRSQERFRDLPFVFYTATYIEQKDEEFAMRLGADRFFRKPMEPRAFLKQIRNFMDEVAANRGGRRPAVPDSEEEILKLYNERLIHKLEQKMADLEKEISERRRIEEDLRKNLDIQVEAEKALQEKEQFLDAIVENIPDMIFVKDARNLGFIRINKAGENLLGIKRDDLYGKNDRDFFPEKEAAFFMETDKDVLLGKALVDIPEETIETRPRGRRVLHTKKISLLDEQGTPKYLLGISEDITEAKRIEKEMRESLREKETLLHEIHHRVKNNMQVISSLLRLQSNKTSDPLIREVFNASQNRIRTMALVHEKLYSSKNLSKISFSDYIQTLAVHLFHSYHKDDKHIHLRMNLESVDFGIETAVPCGLILNELLSNALKYAFPDERRGEIEIGLRSLGPHQYLLTVRDDGVGIPKHLDLQNPTSFGWEVIKMLVSQIDGSVEIRREKGTTVLVTLKEAIYRPRV